MKITTKIELTEKDLAEILAEKFNLDPAKTSVNVYKYDAADPRETSYVKVTVEGEAK